MSPADILKMGYSVEINQVVVDDFDEWSESWNSLRVALGLGGDGAWENGQRDSQVFQKLNDIWTLTQDQSHWLNVPLVYG